MRTIIAMEENREAESPPSLLISQGPLLEKHLLYNVSDNRYRVLNYPILLNRKVVECGHGWLVLLELEEDECCLFNPISMDTIALPRLEYANGYKQCILTKPPNEPDCHILFNGGCKLSFCRIGDNEYMKLHYRSRDFRWVHCILMFQGQIYAIMEKETNFRFLSIHFSGKTLDLRPIELDYDRPSLIHRPSLEHHIWLVESPQSELLMIQKTYLTTDVNDGVDFRVFQIDTNQKLCIELVDIGERTIFLSYLGCGYCCTSTQGVKSNSVYYTNNPFYCKGRNIYIFDLKDRSTTSKLPSRTVGRKLLSTSWVYNTAFS